MWLAAGGVIGVVGVDLLMAFLRFCDTFLFAGGRHFSSVVTTIFLAAASLSSNLTCVTRHVGAALDMVEILGLHLFLISLPVVEVVEVGNNDRHRKRDRQHAGNGTQGPYYFSPHTYWPAAE